MAKLSQAIAAACETTARLIKEYISQMTAPFTAHTNSKNNPHGVTAAQAGARPDTWLPTIAEIGAAPAGYVAEVIGCYTNDEIDAAITTEWAKMGDNTTRHIVIGILAAGLDLGGGNWHVTLNQVTYAYGTLTAINYTSGGVTMQRALYNGTWAPWDWVNPPMLLGVEYRTTERWQGKAVYTMLVHCGAGAVAGGYKTVSTTIAGTAKTVRYHVDITNSAGNKLGNPPLEYADGSVLGRITVSASNDITMMCYQDLSETDTYCQLWYTKD